MWNKDGASFSGKVNYGDQLYLSAAVSPEIGYCFAPNAQLSVADAAVQSSDFQSDSLTFSASLSVLHNIVIVPAKDPTDFEYGNIEHWRCVGCGKLFSSEDGSHEISESIVIISHEAPQLRANGVYTVNQKLAVPCEKKITVADGTRAVFYGNGEYVAKNVTYTSQRSGGAGFGYMYLGTYKVAQVLYYVQIINLIVNLSA